MPRTGTRSSTTSIPGSKALASTSKAGKENGRTPAVAEVFIKLWRHTDHFDMKVYFDAAGTDEMTIDEPLALLGNGKGKIQFNFIPPSATEPVVTADLVIIGQTVRDGSARRGHRRASPFKHPFSIPAGKFYPTYYLPSPAGDDDPTNLKSVLKCGSTGYVEGGKLDIIKVPGAKPTEPYKYTIIALCDGATAVTGIDPTGIINPK
jgi:hypothetical protein